MIEKPTLPGNYIAEASKKLKNAIIAVQAMESICTSQEELYNAVENLCSHRMAKILYINLQSLMETHIQKNLKPLLQDYIDEESFLKTIEDVWSRYCHEMLLIQSIFFYLDSTYVLQMHGVLPICIDNQYRTIDGLLNLIEDERNGGYVDRKLLKNSLHILSDLGEVNEEELEHLICGAMELLKYMYGYQRTPSIIISNHSSFVV